MFAVHQIGQTTNTPFMIKHFLKLSTVYETSAIHCNMTPKIGPVPLRTSDFSKEEVDAILVQCGKLSHGFWAGATPSSCGKQLPLKNSCDDEGTSEERCHCRRQRLRSPSLGRRRTPSTERDQHWRSNSNERRVSRSPGKRSRTAEGRSNNRPERIVSVPATVTSMVAKKSNSINNSVVDDGGRQRIATNRTVEEVVAVGSRSAASLCPGSLVKENANANQQMPLLSHSSSKEAEQSLSRRNPLSGMDSNVLLNPQVPFNIYFCNRRNDMNEDVAEGTPLKGPIHNMHQESSVQSKEHIHVIQGAYKNSEDNAGSQMAPSENDTEQKRKTELAAGQLV